MHASVLPTYVHRMCTSHPKLKITHPHSQIWQMHRGFPLAGNGMLGKLMVNKIMKII
jgi:hypothetical protein